MTCVPTTSDPYTAFKNIPGTVSIPDWNGLQDTLLNKKKKKKKEAHNNKTEEQNSKWCALAGEGQSRSHGLGEQSHLAEDRDHRVPVGKRTEHMSSQERGRHHIDLDLEFCDSNTPI